MSWLRSLVRLVRGRRRRVTYLTTDDGRSIVTETGDQITTEGSK